MKTARRVAAVSAVLFLLAAFSAATFWSDEANYGTTHPSSALTTELRQLGFACMIGFGAGFFLAGSLWLMLRDAAKARAARAARASRD